MKYWHLGHLSLQWSLCSSCPQRGHHRQYSPLPLAGAEVEGSSVSLPARSGFNLSAFMDWPDVFTKSARVREALAFGYNLLLLVSRSGVPFFLKHQGARALE
jgi:hypothetical protein